MNTVSTYQSTFRLTAATATAAMVLSSALYNPGSAFPGVEYSFSPQSDVSFSARPSLENINNIDLHILDKAEVLYSFVQKLGSESIDIDPRIADIVNDNFWDLL